MSVCPQVCGPAVAARFSHGSVFAHVHELHHRVSFDEHQDLPAGEPTADGVKQSVNLPPAAQSLYERGWDPNSRAEHLSREARGGGTYVKLIKK